MSVLLVAKNILFTLVVPGTVAVYVPLFVFAPDAPALSTGSVPGAGVMLAGSAVYFWCLWDFALFGRGTPAPIDPPRKLVIRGLYKFSRNPMYLGVLLVIFGWSLLLRSPALAVYGVAVAACFHLFVVMYEEPHLRRVFGESYERYCAHVGRWISFRNLNGE